MPTYTADSIIGKTLFAKKSIQLKRTPADAAAAVFTVSPGGQVGIVNSYINPKEGRNKNLYWQFQDQNNTPFYAEHTEGAFDIKALGAQGAVSLETQQEQAAAENQSWFDKSKEVLYTIGIGTAVFLLAKTYILKS